MQIASLLPSSWRWKTHGPLLLPALVAAAIAAALHFAGAFALPDGVIYDKLSMRTPAGPPTVTIVERSNDTDAEALAAASFDLGAERVAFLSDPGHSFDGLLPELRERVAIGLAVDTRLLTAREMLGREFASERGKPRYLPRQRSEPEYGIHRSLNAMIGEGSQQIRTFETFVADRPPSARYYYVPMPRSLAFAVLAPDQLSDGDLAAGDLEGMTVLVATRAELSQNLLATPLRPNSQSISVAHFSAFAMQSLTSETAITKVSGFQALLLIIGSAFVAGIGALLVRRRLIAVLFGASLCVAVVAVGWLALTAFSSFLPFWGMATAVALSILGTIFLLERQKDARLENALVGAMGQTASHAAFRNREGLPALLQATAVTAGVERMLLLSPEDPFAPNPPASLNATVDDLSPVTREQLPILAKNKADHRSMSVTELLPNWPGEVRLRTIGTSEDPLFWFYTFGNQPDAEAGEFIASSLAQSFLAMQKSNASLSAQQRGLRVIDPVDFRVVNAIDLIARHGRQFRRAVDQLSASVMVFDVVGFPLHANPQMIDLLEASDLNPQTVLLPEIIEKLTDLSQGQSDALLRDVLREGGEASAPITGIPGVHAVLRVSSADPATTPRENVVVLEAFDTSELARLSDLRLAVSEFVDVQMRNDLETIALGAALARKPSSDSKRRLRMIDKIMHASQTATNRLDEMNRLARTMPMTHEFHAHPIQLKAVVEKAGSQLLEFAQDYGVDIELSLPEVSGYSVGDPFVLTRMLEALLRLVIADSPPEGEVQMALDEAEVLSTIVITGGFGMAQERFQQALDAPPRKEIPEFQIVKESLLTMSSWGADFAFETEPGEGYKFTLNLRRIV